MLYIFQITDERSSLSATRTKKISAEDERPSAKAAGYVAIVVLLAILGGIILLDLNRLLRSFRLLHENMVRPNN